MTCLGKRPTLGEIAFPPGGGQAEGTLSIPAQGCPVQRLALHGLAAGAFETVDARIAGLRLEKVAR